MKLCLENVFRIEFLFSRYSHLTAMLFVYWYKSIHKQNICKYHAFVLRLKQMWNCFECSHDIVGCLQCLRELKQLLQKCSIVITVVTKAEEGEEQMVTQ